MKRRTLLGLAAGSAAGLAAPLAAAVDPKSRKGSPGGPYRLSVAAYSYRQFLQGARKNMTLLDFIEKAALMGSDGVELTEYYFDKPVTPEYVLQLKHAAQLWGVSITGTPIGNSFTAPVGPERDRQIDTYKKWVDVSALLGSPSIRTFAGTTPKGLSESEARKNVIQCLEVVTDYAGSKGVFVGLENHGGVVAEADGLLEIVHAVKSPWLGINLDSGNFRTADPYGDLARCAPYAVTVQYKTEITPKGQPTQPADFGRVVGILKAAGYRGFITLEYEAKDDPLTAVPRHLAEMRAVLQKSA